MKGLYIASFWFPTPGRVHKVENIGKLNEKVWTFAIIPNSPFASAAVLTVVPSSWKLVEG